MAKEKETLSWSDSIKKFFGEKIDSGFVVSDKAKADELLKLGLEQTGKGHSHRTKAKKFLGQIMNDKGISIADKGFKKEIQGLNVNLTPAPKIGVSPEQISGQPQPQTQPQTQPASSGAAPFGSASVSTGAVTSGVPKPQTPYEKLVGTQTPATPERPQLPPSAEKDYQELFKYGTDLLSKVYIQTGIVQSEEVTEKPQQMKAKEWKAELEKFGSHVAGYCYRHNIPIPTFLELFLLGAEGIFVLGSPLIMFFLAGRKSSSTSKEDSKLDSVDDSISETKTETKTDDVMSKIPNIETETDTGKEKTLDEIMRESQTESENQEIIGGDDTE